MGPKIPNAEDRRVARTRRTLHLALIALLHERNWDEVSVQDVCDRADVGRSTFYTHFADKEELLHIGFDQLRDRLRAQLRQPAEGGIAGPLRFAEGLIVHAHENQRLFRALIGKRTGQAILQRVREFIVGLVRDDLAASSVPAGPAREAAVRFIAGAFLELLTWSLEARSAPAPADLEQMFLKMASAAIRALPNTRAPPG